MTERVDPVGLGLLPSCKCPRLNRLLERGGYDAEVIDKQKYVPLSTSDVKTKGLCFREWAL